MTQEENIYLRVFDVFMHFFWTSHIAPSAPPQYTHLPAPIPPDDLNNTGQATPLHPLPPMTQST